MKQTLPALEAIMIRLIAALSLALSIFSANPTHAQDPHHEETKNRLAPDEPVQVVLRSRKDLSLSENQVIKLQEIADTLRLRNLRVIEKVDQVVAEHRHRAADKSHLVGEREKEREIEHARAVLVPLLKAVALHNLRAMDAVEGVLDPEQRQVALTLLADQHAAIRAAKEVRAEGPKKESGGH